MRFCCEIRLLADDTAGINFLWGKIYLLVHLALVGIKDENDHVSVGLSFPGYDVDAHKLGDSLRIISPNEASLSALRLPESLRRFRDNVVLDEVRKIPEGIDSFVRFRRQRAKTSVERLARRRAARHNVSADEALRQLSGFQEERLSVPFVQIKSLSGDHRFRLYIHQETGVPNIEGTFSCYGLSAEASLPDF